MSQQTYSVCIIKTNWLMLFGEKITVYFQNNVESIITLCGQNSESLLLLKQVLQVIINVL